MILSPPKKAMKKINNAKAWTSEEDELFRKLIISNAPAALKIRRLVELGLKVKAK